MKDLFKIVLLGSLLLCGSGVQAATVTYDLYVEVLNGPFTGNIGNGSFSYDDATLTNIGYEELTPILGSGDLTVELTVFGQTFHESDDIDYPDYPALGFENGVITYLDFIVSENDLNNTTDIDYLGVTNFAIWDLWFENNSYVAELYVNVDPVPVPAAIWLFGSGLLDWLGCLGKGPNVLNHRQYIAEDKTGPESSIR